MQQPLAVTIVGGYLGAGKTTLINNLLRHANGQRLAVLVNEFGALPIDEDLIEAKSDDLIAITGGCVCCSFGSDLTAALMTMAERSPLPDHIIIESSGVAMPGAIAANIGLMQQYLLAGVVVLADSETIQAQATDEYLGDTITRQLDDADLIVQTKNDLVSVTQRNLVLKWLASKHTVANVISAEKGSVPIEVILGQFMHRANEHISPHSDQTYHSEVLELPERCNATQLAETLTNSDTGILRAKGFLLDQDGQTQLLQIVGRRFTLAPSAVCAKPQIVCIGLRGKFSRGDLERGVATSDSKSFLSSAS